MSKSQLRRLERLETAALSRLPVAGVPVFVPTHLSGTAEAMAEQAAWQALHPGPAVICRVFDGRSLTETQEEAP